MPATIADETKLPLWAQNELRSLRLYVAKLERRQAWLHGDEPPRYVLPKGDSNEPRRENGVASWPDLES